MVAEKRWPTESQFEFMRHLLADGRRPEYLSLMTGLHDSSVRMRLYRLRDRGLVEKRPANRQHKTYWKLTRSGRALMISTAEQRRSRREAHNPEEPSVG